jgi:hypothetical protein
VVIDEPLKIAAQQLLFILQERTVSTMVLSHALTTGRVLRRLLCPSRSAAKRTGAALRIALKPNARRSAHCESR